jgi:rhamnogalacturonyl hydrolase YesR
MAASRRRAVDPPVAVTPDSIIALATRAADRVALSTEPRLHWENAVYLDGLVLFGDELNRRTPGSGDLFIERAASVVLDSNDAIDTVFFGDGTAFVQAAMDLYRVLPPGDPRRAALLVTAAGPMKFAEHAIRDTPANAPPRDPWWIDGGYGARFWQDDLYMLVPWLALYGSAQNGLPANELARNLAYEWIEAYAYEHRPESSAAVPSSTSRRGALLWDESSSLFQHQPETAGLTDWFWGRGNGWALIALIRAAESLDAPYTGGRYDQVIGRDELRSMLRASAASLIARRTPDGGWGSFLARTDLCPVAETSATALLTFFLARGINDGWLDRGVYQPILMRAFAVLMQRVARDGTITSIQPPGVGPACDRTSSDNPSLNLNYGAGAVLLAASEVLKLD